MHLIYVDHDEIGVQLYDQLLSEGKDLGARPGCPNLIERIESGLLSYGNDMDMNDTPLECGLDAFVSFNPDIDYLGKEVLEKQQQQGVSRSLVGIIMDLNEISVTQHLPILNGENQIGTLRSACYSPDFGKCLGIAMVDKTHQTLDQDLKLQINGIEISAKMTNLPFTK
jgi:dimethylsulfoniopropionate demethylase